MGLIEMERMKRYSEKPAVLGYLGNTVSGGGATYRKNSLTGYGATHCG